MNEVITKQNNHEEQKMFQHPKRNSIVNKIISFKDYWVLMFSIEYKFNPTTDDRIGYLQHLNNKLDNKWM